MRDASSNRRWRRVVVANGNRLCSIKEVRRNEIMSTAKYSKVRRKPSKKNLMINGVKGSRQVKQNKNRESIVRSKSFWIRRRADSIE